MVRLFFVALLMCADRAAAQSAPEGWIIEPNSNGTIYQNANGSAQILVGEWAGKTDAALQLSESAKVIDQQQVCKGIALAPTTKVLGGQGLQKRVRGPFATCSLTTARTTSGISMVLAMEENGANANAENIALSVLASKLPTSLPSNSAQTSPSPAPVTRGGPAPKADGSILGVHYGSQMMMMGFGEFASMQRFETMTILFRNGTACYNCLDEWVNDPSLAAYRRDKPKDNGRWRKVGAQYQISYPGSKTTQDADADRLIRSAPAGTRLNNSFFASGINTTGTTDSMASVAYDQILTLRRDGRFLWGGNYAAFGTATGGSFSSSGTSPNRTGRYVINGYTIRFEYDDGKIETKSLGIDPRGQRFVVIDSSIYITRD